MTEPDFETNLVQASSTIICKNRANYDKSTKIGPDMIESMVIKKIKRAKPYLFLVRPYGGLNSPICPTHAAP